MFIGHFGVAFGAKNIVRTVSLGTLIMASQFLDLIWPTFLLIGVEHVRISPTITETTPLEFTHFPISHSLVMVLVWSILFSTVYGLVRKNWGAAIFVGLCVLSHWLLDLIVHIPDLQIYPGGGGRLGFGLWHSKPGTVLLEMVIFITGLVYYLRVTEEENAIGQWGLWSLVVILAVIWAVNLFGPVPSSVTAIAIVGHLQWLLVIWGYLVDRNRFSDPLDVSYDPVPIGPSAVE